MVLLGSEPTGLLLVGGAAACGRHQWAPCRARVAGLLISVNGETMA